MPYKDVTYDNGFTERYYYDETDDEQALRMSRMNSVAKFPLSKPPPFASPDTALLSRRYNLESPLGHSIRLFGRYSWPGSKDVFLFAVADR